MTTLPLLENWLSPALVRAVGYALLHSLWQGAGLAGVLAAALPLLRRHRAEVRYATAAAALASLLLAVGLTFGFYYAAGPAPAAIAALPETARPVAAELALSPAPAERELVASPPATTELAMSWLQASRARVEPYLPVLVAGWLLGLLLMSGRLLGGLVYASQLRRAGAQALGAEWPQRLAALARRAGLRRPVALLESARVAGPLVLGHLRPAILLPLGAVASLSPALLEALLAHELAHIVRRDYLLNLGLAVAEVLFFYHPAVWFMAGCLRAERENCCDDQAAALCGGDRLRVARALAALAELTASPAAMPRLALAAAGAGGRGSLLARVRRLALSRPTAPTLGEGLLAGALAGLGLLGLGTGVALATPAGSLLTKEKEAAQTEQQLPVSLTDTAREPLAAAAAPTAPDPAGPADVAVEPMLGVDSQVINEPRVAVYSPAQTEPRPPRRGRASTVVIEKDKKGRVVSLEVDGQPVETATDRRGKKARRGKAVRTVEVVVPGPPERPAPPEVQSFSFNLSTDAPASRARRAARQGLAEALRDPDLNAEQRREIARELRKLKVDITIKRADLDRQLGDFNRQFKEFHFNLNKDLPDDGGTVRVRPHYHTELRYDAKGRARMRVRPGDADARQAERDAEQAAHDAEQADRDAEQADRDAEQADHEGDQAGQEDARADAAARRAELRARIAADEAELRALNGASGPGLRPYLPAPRAPRVPRAPLAPLAPFAPLAPQAPTPPAPPAAPNTAQLREELRRDGLINDEKHFSFELNDEGGRANGQALTPAQVAKYRQLLRRPVRKGKGSKSTFSISVDEH